MPVETLLALPPAPPSATTHTAASGSKPVWRRCHFRRGAEALSFSGSVALSGKSGLPRCGAVLLRLHFLSGVMCARRHPAALYHLPRGDFTET
jgi:hypothetical protein